MAKREHDSKKDPVTPDTSEYSSSLADETRPLAEGRESTGNSRLIPGGEEGSEEDPGMSGMDREDVPSGAEDPGQAKYGDTPGGSDQSG